METTYVVCEIKTGDVFVCEHESTASIEKYRTGENSWETPNYVVTGPYSADEARALVRKVKMEAN